MMKKKNKVIIEKKNFLWSTRGLLNNPWIVLDNNLYYELYRMNGDIRWCVHKIAWSVGKNWIRLQDNNRQEVQNFTETDRVFDFFKTPTFEKFKLSLFKNYLISWELYIVPIQNKRGETIRFEVLDSRAIQKTVERGMITGFKYYSKGFFIRDFKPDEIAFFKFEDDVRDTNNGMSILTGLVYDALSDLESMKSNYSFYQNSAVPSAILLLDNDLSYEEQQNAKELFDDQFKGSENQHKTLVAWGVSDVKTLSLTNRDMEFIEQRMKTTEKTCSVFWVPKTILWYTESVNYNNGETQKKEYIEGAVTTNTNELEYILNKLSEMFLPDVWDKYRIKLDSETLETKEETFESQRKDVQNGIKTINEVRVERGLEEVKEENANKLLISKNFSLLEDITLDPVLLSEE